MSCVIKTALIVSGALTTALAIMPVSQAQDFSAYEQNQQQASPASPIPGVAHPVAGVRYTTGAVTTQGWEKSLTDADPNLRRWNWSAITSFTQSSYNHLPAGAFLKKNKPEAQQAMQPADSKYVKPIKISADTYA